MPLSTQETELMNLADYEVHSERGFLPAEDPLTHLSGVYALWDELAYDLPKRLMTDNFRRTLEQMPVLDIDGLTHEREQRRAMMALSYLGHAYVWGEPETAQTLPASIGVPWYHLSQKLGRLPVLSYASYALDNWRRIDPNRPIELGNIALLQNFLGGQDEEWFILIHVDIEARAAAALNAVPSAIQAAKQSDIPTLTASLKTISAALEGMFNSLSRMPERCDPYIYYHRVRPYIHGWKNNPALPNGLTYEGVEAYGGEPQLFRGETGAQSSIIPSFDALLGIYHKEDPLKEYLMEMRDYMPPKHRAFMEAIEAQSQVRACVNAHHESHPELREIYNDCVRWIEMFRSKHLEYAASYIYKQHAMSDANPTKVGTGGTPFMKYLKKHRNESGEHKI